MSGRQWGVSSPLAGWCHSFFSLCMLGRLLPSFPSWQWSLGTLDWLHLPIWDNLFESPARTQLVSERRRRGEKKIMGLHFHLQDAKNWQMVMDFHTAPLTWRTIPIKCQILHLGGWMQAFFLLVPGTSILGLTHISGRSVRLALV